MPGRRAPHDRPGGPVTALTAALAIASLASIAEAITRTWRTR